MGEDRGKLEREMKGRRQISEGRGGEQILRLERGESVHRWGREVRAGGDVRPIRESPWEGERRVG